MLNVPYPHSLLVSYLKNGIHQTEPTNSHHLKAIALRIKFSGVLRRQTQYLRDLSYDSDDSDEQKKYKLKLPYVIPAGTFSKRGNAGLLMRSGWLVLDFDKLNNPRKLLRRLLSDKKLSCSIVLAFVSPRGNGLKVWVAVDLNFDHKSCYEAVVAHVQAKHPNWCKDGKLDVAADISRGCLLCHDSEVYFNKAYATAPAFPMPVEERGDIFDDSGDRKTLASTREVNLNTIERWVSKAERVPDFADERNMWRDLGFAFASIGEPGRSFFHRVSQTSKKYDQKVTDKKFSYWLEHYNGSINIGTFIHHCKEAGLSLSGELSNVPISKQALPSIPTEVYDQLPAFLRKCCSPFDLAHERDTTLLSTLGVVSGILPSVGGTYAQRAFGLNLFLFIIGPAASGKGTMMWAKRLAQPYHKRLIQESVAAWEKYEAELAAYKAATNKGGNKLDTPPRPPDRLLLYLPGNSTAAALLRVLAESKGRGIICETEADTLTNALRSEFGGFGDILRSIFQHEPVTMIRQADRLHIDLERPALSIVLTGTPGQLQRLIPSAEDGLASRFLFYRFDQTPIWKDVSPNGGLALDPHFDALAKELDGLLEALPEPIEGTSYPVTITLTAADWIKMNEGGSAGLQEAWQEVGDSGASTAKRLGLIAWRITGILTVLRYHEHGLPLKGELVADSRDVTTALTIMDIARAHALAILESLPRPNIGRAGNKFEEKSTKRKEAIALRAQGHSLGEIATRLGVAKSTVQRWCA